MGVFGLWEEAAEPMQGQVHTAGWWIWTQDPPIVNKQCFHCPTVVSSLWHAAKMDYWLPDKQAAACQTVQSCTGGCAVSIRPFLLTTQTYRNNLILQWLNGQEEYKTLVDLWSGVGGICFWTWIRPEKWWSTSEGKGQLQSVSVLGWDVYVVEGYVYLAVHFNSRLYHKSARAGSVF